MSQHSSKLTARPPWRGQLSPESYLSTFPRGPYAESARRLISWTLDHYEVDLAKSIPPAIDSVSLAIRLFGRSVFIDPDDHPIFSTLLG